MNPMRSTWLLGSVGLLVLLYCGIASAQAEPSQQSDGDYFPVVETPTYNPEEGPVPVVAVDSGHGNFHTVKLGPVTRRGKYTGFRHLLEADGVVVQDFNKSYVADCINSSPSGIPDCPYFQALLDIDVLVIASPKQEITDDEAAAIATWVRGDEDTCVNCSRSLMLIGDHNINPALYFHLSEELGLNWVEAVVEATFIENPQPNQGLGDLDTSHVVTEGRDGIENSLGVPIDEVVTEVTTFLGSCFSEAQPLTGGVSVLTLLPEVPDPFCDDRSQGMLFRHGRGSVYASGEAAMFTAQQLNSDPPFKFGMQETPPCEPEDGVLAAQDHCNEQYLLNIVHWLDGELDEDGDGVIDKEDNCRDVPNPNQDDTDGDLCGNICDADYDQTGFTDLADFDIFTNDLILTFDLRGDHTEPVVGPVGFLDFGIFGQLFHTVPGPSGTTTGTLACPIIPPNDRDNDGITDDVDNCPDIPNTDQSDSDEDGVGDVCDNCSAAPNPGQVDTDGDLCGNICDADYDQSGFVGTLDFGIFSQIVGTTDLRGDHTEPVEGIVESTEDFDRFNELFGTAPGPSGTTSGTTACP